MASIENTEYDDAMRQYYIEEYMRMLNLDKAKFNQSIMKYIKTFNPRRWSNRNRIVANIQFLKYLYITGKAISNTICFKATFDGTSCIYANVHVECDSSGRIVPKFVCTGPTFRSQDGEYRGRVIYWEQFNAIFDYKPEPFELVEALVLTKLQDDEILFQADIFASSINVQQIEQFIDERRLAIKLYILCWIFDFHNIHNKLVENHINPAYQYVLYQEDDLPVYEKLIDDYGGDIFTELQYRIMRTLSNARISLPKLHRIQLAVGQKTHPIGALEAVNTNDINFDTWREIYIARLATNLALNLISPCFPYINNWFYIHSAHGGLFDNAAMHEKYEHSKIAAEVTTQLHAIDKYNYVDKNRDNSPITNKFARLSRAIHKSIIYGDSDIKLTDLAICVTSENVGYTLRDVPMLVAHNKFYPGMNELFTNVELFSKIMFEFIYSFYCMNTKIGIIHGDLHMNNATIYQLYNYINSDDSTFVVNNPKIVYIVNQEAYIFPHHGCFANIIDFSRSIIGDRSRLEHEFSERFAELYFKDQHIKIIQLLHHYFPRLIEKYHTDIGGMIERNFPIMFKIMTAIDTYSIMTNIQSMITIDETFVKKQIKVNPGIVKLLDKLISLSSDLITNNIKMLLNGKIIDPSDLEWPNLTILRTVFANFYLSDKTINTANTIVEVFNSNNKLIYDIDDPDAWGPLLSIDKEIELRKKFGIELDPNTAAWMEFKQRDETAAIDKILSKYEQDEIDVLQFEEWMFM